MRPFESLSLSDKLNRLVDVNTLLVLLLSGFVMSVLLSVRYFEETQQQMEIVSKIVAHNSSAALMFEDQKLAANILESLKVHSSVLSATLYSHQGTAFSSYVREAKKGQKTAETSIRQPDDLPPEVNIHEMAEPSYYWDRMVISEQVYFDGENLGVLKININVMPIYYRLMQYLAILVALLLLLLKFSRSLSRRYSERLLKPILELTAGFQQVSKYSDFTYRIEKKNIDEIGDMVDGFNFMLEQISKRDQELADYSAQLERKVSIRTEDLNRANSDLQKKTEEAVENREIAEKANRAKGEFLARMSHEIRTPLNSILGTSELMLLSREHLESSQLKDISRIQGSGNILLAIVNDLIDFSLIEAGKLKIENAPLDLHKLVSDLSEFYQKKLTTTAVHFSCDFDEMVENEFCSDANRIRQILINLMENAIKFTEEGTIQLQVSVFHAEASSTIFRFEVRDSGIGIAEEVQQNIFSPFSQADASISRRFGGTGLGLSICSELVQMMHGRIGVESKKGEGACFWFTLPLDRNSGERSQNLSSTNPSETTQFPSYNAKILLVEDNRANQEVVSSMLDLFDCSTVIAEHGQQVLPLLTEQPFDLILMDLGMPDIDGIEITKKIREWEVEGNRQTLPIVALTAHVNLLVKQQCQSAGMDDFLTKPFKIEQIGEVLGRWIGEGMKNGQ